MVADPDTDSTERYSRQSIDRCQPPTHQHKALGTNESVRGFCYFLDMFYQEALPRFWFVSRVDSLLTIADRHWRTLTATFEKAESATSLPFVR